MKSIFLTATLFVAASTVSFAQQDTTQTSDQDTTALNMIEKEMDMALAFAQEEKAIEAEQLPEAVRATLKNEKYKGWKVESAKTVQAQDGTLYKVIISNGEKKETLTMDENGNAIA